MNYLRQIKLVALLLGLLALCSCSILSPIKGDTTHAYVINEIPHVPKQTQHEATILVFVPDTLAAYDTIRMAYTDKSYQINYFALNHWADKPAIMLQPLIVQTLVNSGFYQAVVTPPFDGLYDYALRTQILQLEQDFTGPYAGLRLVVRAQLTSFPDNEVIATETFSVYKIMDSKSPYGGVVAANKAVAALLEDLARFCVRNANKEV